MKNNGEQQPQTPNVLLIMCDQLRADVLGCYGNKLVQTPNIDRLAQRGVVFNRAYSQTPVCVPARYGLLAGMQPFRLGLVDNGVPSREIEHPLPLLLRKQGYSTAAVGKMHFTPPRMHYGFDRMLLSEELTEHYADDDFLQHLREAGWGHVDEPHGRRSDAYYVPQTSELPEELHTTAWTAETACRIIRQNRDRPFFAFVSFIKPHPPFDPCPPYDAMYDPDAVPMPICRDEEKRPDDYLIDVQNDYKVNGIDSVTPDDVRRIRAHYYGLVTQIDRQIGRLLDALEENGLADDTVIFFTSDHGEMLGDHHSFGKRTYYEASARVPLIVSWPGGGVPQGASRDDLALLQDIYASALAAAGAPLPEEASGIDLLGPLSGGAPVGRERIIAEIGRDRALKFMLRRDDWKYVYHVNGGTENLYLLSEDPNELENAAPAHPELCRQCREELAAYYAGCGFGEALDGTALKRLDYRRPPATGYLDQFPVWRRTVAD